jgi:hypothetical protein
MLPCFTNDPAAIVAHNVLEVHASGTFSREWAFKKGLKVTRDAFEYREEERFCFEYCG